MMRMLLWKACILLLSLLAISTYALPFASPSEQLNPEDIGQTIQIQTQLHSFVGKPTWLLMIRDVDHNQNVPYLFDFRKADNFWLAFTQGRHYLVSASTLYIETYKPRENRFRKFRINNFCHLESNGRINRAISMAITLTGDLSANTNTFQCQVNKYKDPF